MLLTPIEIIRLLFMPKKVYVLIRRLLSRTFSKIQMRNNNSTTLYADIATSSKQTKARAERVIILDGVKTLVNENQWLATHEVNKFNQISEIISNVINKEQSKLRVLEIGVGEGRTLSLLRDSILKKNKHIEIEWFGIDLTFERINNLKVNFEINTSMASGNELPYADNSFDIVFTHHVLEQIPRDFGEVIKEANRVGLVYLCMEPSIEVADLEGKINMLTKDHLVGVQKFLKSNYPDYKTVTPTAVAKAANPTMYYILDNRKQSEVAEFNYMCPYSKQRLLEHGGSLITENSKYAYPIINGIPLLNSNFRVDISKNSRIDSI
jgi:ubiquinone/menaquinone biosynthesis C-methylase UbiE